MSGGKSFLKSLIFTDAGEETQETKKPPTPENFEKPPVSFPRETAKTEFPKETPTYSADSTMFDDPKAQVVEERPIVVAREPHDNPYLESVKALYEEVFSKLNKEGVDFYEFFKNITMDGNINNIALYPMAFNMLKNISSGFTKESVIADAEFYLTELQKQYQELSDKGQNKKQGLLSEKSAEQSSLTGDIGSLETQIRELNVQLETKKRELREIDGKYSKELTKVEDKLEANSIAKEGLTRDIEQVVNNIKTTIK